ncbi:MAG TPA: type II toxin-antitoxin system VapC family toxin [Candidatus Nitrosotenuis sp.]|jgi:predicted nucleic acid-binding protein
MKDRQTRLYDTSAFLNLLLNEGSKSLSVLSGQAVLDLTTYELGNSIWRLSYLQKKITKAEACSLLDSCLKVISSMNVLHIKGLEEDVKELSSGMGQSFYDSAYLVVAKNHNLELVTDNKKLLKAALNSKIKASPS